MRIGRERALVYKALVLTGLRANELRTLECRDLSFGDVPFVSLRHSNINLTMSTYTDARLLDTAEAVERLPSLTIAKESLRMVAPKTGKEGQIRSIGDHSQGSQADTPETTKPRKTQGFTGFSGSRDDKIRTCDLCTPRAHLKIKCRNLRCF